MKNILLIILLALLTINIYGQEKKFSFGLNGGTNLSIPYDKEVDLSPVNLDFEHNRFNKPNFGYFAEAEIQFQLSEKVITKWTIGYQFTQYKYESGPDNFTETGKLEMAGLCNSLSLDYLFTQNNIYIGVGLFHKYLLTAVENSELEGNWLTPGMLNDPNGQATDDPSIPLDIFYDHINEIKRHEFGLLIEAGKYFKLGDKIKLNSFLRYNQSLIQIYPDNFKMKHYSMYLSLGVGFVY